MKMQLIDEWTSFYKLYSVWVMALIAVLPDIYNAAISAGLLNDGDAPKTLSYIVKVVAFLGIVARIIKQAKLDAEQKLHDQK